MYALLKYLIIFTLGMENRLQVVGGDLTIDPVMLSDDGSFTCEASNIVGVIQATVYLNVQCKYQAT